MSENQIESPIQITSRSVKKEDKKQRYIHLLPDLKDVKKEEKYNLELIEQKKNVKYFQIIFLNFNFIIFFFS